MTSQGACALLAKSEPVSVFLVAKLRLDPQGRIEAVLLTEVDRKTKLLLSAEEVPVTEVIELIHSGHQVMPIFGVPSGHEAERRFVVFIAADGKENIVLDGAPLPGRELKDIVRYDSTQRPVAPFVSGFSRHAYRASDRAS